MDPLVLAVIVGILQGIFEWLPISSEGNITLFLTVVAGTPATAAVQFSLFLHAGTALSALAYYREEVWGLLAALPAWRPREAFADLDRATLTFVVVATLVSAGVGALAYLVIEDLAGELAGGAFVALIGVLLVATGVLQRVASRSLGDREFPDLFDAVLVGAMQGLAILPGVSRSGGTAGALLLRGHDGESAFQLSFLLSIPAAFAAGVLVLFDTGALDLFPDAGGLLAVTPDALGIAPVPAALALAVSALVGFLTIDALMRVVRRVAFWGVCVGLGALAILGGVLVTQM